MAKDFLLTPLTYLPGVGPRRAKALAEELDLYTYLDLLHYFPHEVRRPLAHLPDP